MGKLGVGVGDDFPIDDGKPAGADPGPDGFSHAEYEARRAEWQRQREAFREQRRQWRDHWRAEWRERKHAFREEMRARMENGEGPYCYEHGGDYHRHWRSHHPFRILGLLGLIAVAIVIFTHVYVLFGLLVLAGLFFAYRGGFDHYGMFDFTPARGPSRPSASTPAQPTASPSTPPSPPAPPADAPKG